MDQVSTPPRSRSSSTAAAVSGSPTGQHAANGYNVPLSGPEALAAEAESDSSDDPYSPGSARVTVDPLAEPIGALVGALLAMLTLMVPLLGVVSDRRDEPASSSAPARSIRLSAAGGAMQP